MPATWLSAGSSILGGLMGGSSAEKAAKAQQAAAQAAQAEIGRQYDTTRKDLAPWRNVGKHAVRRLDFLLGTGGGGNPAVGQARRGVRRAEDEYNALRSAVGGTPGSTSVDADGNRVSTPGTVGRAASPGALRSAKKRLAKARNALEAAQAQPWDPGPEFGSLMRPFGEDDFEADPGYQFRLEEGLKARENSAAARGMQLSGSNLKGLERFGQGLAAQEYGAAWGRDAAQKDRSYNYLSGTSGQGLNAAAQTGAFGAQAAGSIADLMTQGGNAQAAGIAGQSQAWQQAVGGVADAFETRNYMDLMKELRGTA